MPFSSSLQSLHPRRNGLPNRQADDHLFLLLPHSPSSFRIAARHSFYTLLHSLFIARCDTTTPSLPSFPSLHSLAGTCGICPHWSYMRGVSSRAPAIQADPWSPILVCSALLDPCQTFTGPLNERPSPLLRRPSTCKILYDRCSRLTF